jgi:hypothetical protein
MIIVLKNCSLMLQEWCGIIAHFTNWNFNILSKILIMDEVMVISACFVFKNLTIIWTMSVLRMGSQRKMDIIELRNHLESLQ